MQKRWSYIKDSGDFIKKINNVIRYPKMPFWWQQPHELSLRALKGALDKRDEKTILTEELLKMAEFVLKNDYFKFGNKIK